MFLPDGHDLDHPGLFVDIVQNAKAIIRAEADLPGGPEGRRLSQRLAIGRLDGWLEAELFANLFANRAVVFWVDGPQMLRDVKRARPR